MRLQLHIYIMRVRGLARAARLAKLTKAEKAWGTSNITCGARHGQGIRIKTHGTRAPVTEWQCDTSACMSQRPRRTRCVRATCSLRQIQVSEPCSHRVLSAVSELSLALKLAGACRCMTLPRNAGTLSCTRHRLSLTPLSSSHCPQRCICVQLVCIAHAACKFVRSI